MNAVETDEKKEHYINPETSNPSLKNWSLIDKMTIFILSPSIALVKCLYKGLGCLKSRVNSPARNLQAWGKSLSSPW